SALNDAKRWVRRDAAGIVEDLFMRSDADAGLAVAELFFLNPANVSKELLWALSYFCALDNLSTVRRIVAELENAQEEIGKLLLRMDPLVFESIFKTLLLAVPLLDKHAYQQTLGVLRTLASSFVAAERVTTTGMARNSEDYRWIGELLSLVGLVENQEVREAAADLINTFMNDLSLSSFRHELPATSRTA